MKYKWSKQDFMKVCRIDQCDFCEHHGLVVELLEGEINEFPQINICASCLNTAMIAVIQKQIENTMKMKKI